MSGHIRDEVWVDLMEGTAGAEDRRHLEACAACRETLDGLRESWTAAQAARVPEPSPLYWETLRRNVGRTVAVESVRPGVRVVRWQWLAAAAAVVMAVSVFTSPGPSVDPRPTAVAVIPAWSPLSATDDPGIEVLTALQADGDLDAAACTDVASCLVDLGAEDREEITQALQQELKGRTL
jgi:hypothetical protein